MNAGRFKYIKNQYTISLNGKVKLQGEAYPSKKSMGLKPIDLARWSLRGCDQIPHLIRVQSI